MAEYPGLRSRSVYAGADTGARFPNPRPIQSKRGLFLPPGSAPPIFPPAVAAAPFTPTLTAVPKSQQTNQFIQALQGQVAAAAPAKQQTLTDFVRQAYAQQGKGKAALDQESAAIDKVFAQDGGLASELVNARAKRQAAIMLRARDAMNRANRTSNLNRMLGGRNSYNDRATRDAMASIAAQEAVNQADLEAGDIQYVQGQRMGAVGTRGQLGQQYLSSLLAPEEARSNFLRNDISTLGALANLESQNNEYLSPLEQIRQQIAMEEEQQRFQALRNPEPMLPTPVAPRYTPPSPYRPAFQFPAPYAAPRRTFLPRTVPSFMGRY